MPARLPLALRVEQLQLELCTRFRCLPTAACEHKLNRKTHGRPVLPQLDAMAAVRVVQRQLGWEEGDDEDAHLFWCDTSAGTERLVRMSRPQVRCRGA